jgi:hypothetical protein
MGKKCRQRDDMGNFILLKENENIMDRVGKSAWQQDINDNF